MCGSIWELTDSHLRALISNRREDIKMSENDGQEAAGGNSPLKIAIFAVVMVLLVGALVWSMNKSKGLQAEGLPPPKPVDPNAPKKELKMPNMSGMGALLKKKDAEAAPAPAEAAPAEAAPAEAAPAPAN